jgi:hypothetical protein
LWRAKGRKEKEREEKATEVEGCCLTFVKTVLLSDYVSDYLTFSLTVDFLFEFLTFSSLRLSDFRPSCVNFSLKVWLFLLKHDFLSKSMTFSLKV